MQNLQVALETFREIQPIVVIVIGIIGVGVVLLTASHLIYQGLKDTK
jgi:hypothetical protein